MSRWIAITILAIVGLSQPAGAQMIFSQVPLQNIGSSYSASNSIGWNLRFRNGFANFGGGGPLLPPPGVAAGGGGLSGGVGFSGGGVSGNFGFDFSQSSSRSISSTTPSLTTMDGFPGSFSSGVVRPFVVGLTPVVGDYPAPIDPSLQIQQQQLSSLWQSQAELKNRKLQEYLRRAERGQSEGNLRMARANYRGAMALAGEPLRSQIQQRLQAVMTTAKR